MGKMITRSEAAALIGRDPQTVSNWLDAGIIKGRKTTKWTMIDEDSILALNDTLQDLADMEAKVKDALEEKKRLAEQLKEEIHDLRHSIRIMHLVGADTIRDKFFHSLADAAFHSRLMDTRKYEVLNRIIDNKDLDAIADEFFVSRARILQIAGKAVESISRLENYDDLMKETENQRQRLEMADEVIRNKDEEIRQLRQQLKIKEAPEMGEAEEIVQMRKLLNTRLVDIGISVRTLNCLVNDPINRSYVKVETLGDLVQYHKTDLLKLRNFGKKALGELDDLLDSCGLDFGMNVDEYLKKGVELEYKRYDGNR